ncbi:hypothetical protein TSUD_246280 [Trifolium subterraneum]|uniref:FBD domain-containing protein n=1 Tax=Trifolium subterraneum TaxID=3900 RepID=A0A2Z6P751_TRISU|nr:hypothetical protein TSUD_246280 [Trifolium subterraneum]
MTTVKQHPLENLQLVGTFHNNMIPLWPNIFVFPTLVVLKLTKLNVIDNISVDLPSLKTLHLILVYFKNKDNFNKLLNGCPILEDLQTHIFYVEQFHYIEEQVEGVWLKTLSKLVRANITTYERVGFKDQIQFATYILKNAPLLRVMKITVAEPSSSCQNALEELKSCPRISPKCKLSIVS